VLPAVVVAMVVASYAAALAVVYPFNRLRGAGGAFRAEVLKPGLLAAGLGAATVAPAFAAYYSQRDHIPTPGAPSAWAVVVPVSLDLQPPLMPLVMPRTEKWLLYGAAALLAVTAGLALYYRRPAALALTCCALVVPASWLLGQNLLHTFHGLVYPLTLAGAGLLAAARPGTPRPGAARVAVAAAVVVVAAGLRVPQARATAERYAYSEQPGRAVVRQSEALALREEVGTEAVDVALGHYADNHMILAEVAARGVPIRFRAPGWERSLGNWARVAGCPAPDLLLPKARFSVVERNAYAPPGTERYVGPRLKLVEDREAVSVLGVEGTQEMLWDGEWRPGVLIGNTPTTFLIHNGTGRAQSVRLLGDTSAGPAQPDRDRRTLCYKLNDQLGKQSLPRVSKAAIPLRLAPGLNRVEFRVEEAADPPPPPQHPVMLLHFCRWRLEPAEPADAR
jgi:hypothetical protein